MLIQFDSVYSIDKTVILCSSLADSGFRNSLRRFIVFQLILFCFQSERDLAMSDLTTYFFGKNSL